MHNIANAPPNEAERGKVAPNRGRKQEIGDHTHIRTKGNPPQTFYSVLPTITFEVSFRRKLRTAGVYSKEFLRLLHYF